MKPPMQLFQLIHMLEKADPALKDLPVGVLCSAQYLRGFDSVVVKPYTDSDERISGIAITFGGSLVENPLSLEMLIDLLKVHICYYGEQVVKVEHAHGMNKFGPTMLEEIRLDPDYGIADLIFF